MRNWTCPGGTGNRRKNKNAVPAAKDFVRGDFKVVKVVTDIVGKMLSEPQELISDSIERDTTKQAAKIQIIKINIILYCRFKNC